MSWLLLTIIRDGTVVYRQNSAMNDQKSSFRQIFKATSLFGGVQVFQIIITILRSKIIAVLLGPAGMGISGLFNSATNTIAWMTSMGLDTSAVKNISEANAKEDEERVGLVITVFRRLVWITGLLGLVATLALSPWLSEVTFNSSEYTIAFILLSITLLFNQLGNGQRVLLQATRKLEYLAKSRMAGAVIGLILSAPLYYFWRTDGIVPAIIISSTIGLVLAVYYGRKVQVKKVKVDLKTVFSEGNDMLRMGVMLSLSGLITTGAAYIMRVYIGRVGGIEEVGLYHAGFAIVTTYVGLVFSAMGTDYYPRLSGVSHDNAQAARLINQQSEVAILILAPILTVFLIFINLVVILIYSTKFTPVDGMIHWAALGMYFKAVSWAIAFILLAKGESKLFFWNELIANTYTLGFNIIGYKLAGLDGLGISFFVGYVVYLIQVYVLAKTKYRFAFDPDFYRIFLFQFVLGLLCFLVVQWFSEPLSYAVGMPLIILSCVYSFRQMDKRMDMKSVVSDIKRRFIKK